MMSRKVPIKCLKELGNFSFQTGINRLMDHSWGNGRLINKQLQ
ncbi:hypothetical protein SSIN_1439 [Streptococcus sinensis]|uniref:Uncharacterized protein n=1 Tax=Streptococcus sinensis TaxID=176090 RepID=A0A0A0DFF5_9STRE|nr:hypothetical protein SSIN_1439 [Streptococcus sinensis]